MIKHVPPPTLYSVPLTAQGKPGFSPVRGHHMPPPTRYDTRTTAQPASPMPRPVVQQKPVQSNPHMALRAPSPPPPTKFGGPASVAAKGAIQRSQLPDTPTTAYVRARRNSIVEGNQTGVSLRQDFDQVALYHKIVDSEAQGVKAGYVPFYTSVERQSYGLHAILTGIWEGLAGKHVPGFLLMRSPPSIRQAPNSADEFFGNVGKFTSDHAHRTTMISTNLSLFGSCRNGGENTFSAIWSGGIFQLGKSKIVTLVREYLSEAFIPPEYQDKILAVATELYDELAKIEDKVKGMLYQVMVRKDVALDLSYVSIVNGLPLHDKKKTKDWLDDDLFTEALGGTRPTTARGMTAAVLDRQSSPDFWKAFKGQWAEPQARLIMNPTYFATPNDAVRINVYGAHHAPIEAAKAKVRSLVREAVQAMCQPFSLHPIDLTNFVAVECRFSGVSAWVARSLDKSAVFHACADLVCGHLVDGAKVTRETFTVVAQRVVTQGKETSVDITITMNRL